MNKSDKFGEKLRELRLEKGFTQSQLAKAAGVTRRIISHYETMATCPSIDKVNKIADALNVSLNDLMNNRGLPARKQKTENVSLKILKKTRAIEQLPTRDQNTIFSLINSLVEKNKLKGKI